MRHRKLSRRFSRSSSHRIAMMRNLAASLIEHEVIKTTVEKGKELRRFVEPLITRAKVDTLHNRRQIISQLDSRSATSKLFSNLGPRFNETNGGYLRVIKAGFREGDKADMCYVELTIRDLEQEAKVVGELAEENLVMPSDELLENKIEEKAEETAPAPAPEEVKAPKKAAKKTTTKKAESEESQTEVVTPKKPTKKTAEKKDTKTKTETKAATTKKPIKKKKAEKKEEKKSWWSRFFK
tara:strand:- start:281 stop:997 length:717 start_codon:yes stop_codon:yes gene_type:complete